VTTMHALFKGEVERKMTSGSRIFALRISEFEQPYRDAVRPSLRAASAEIIAAAEYSTHAAQTRIVSTAETSAVSVRIRGNPVAWVQCGSLCCYPSRRRRERCQ